MKTREETENMYWIITKEVQRLNKTIDTLPLGDKLPLERYRDGLNCKLYTLRWIME